MIRTTGSTFLVTETQVAIVSVFSTQQKPPEGGNTTTPDLAVVAQLAADTTTQAELHNLEAIHNDQRGVIDAQLQGRNVPPASWTTGK
jgi:hypothetical protein